MEIPEHEVFVTLVRPAAIAAGSIELEKDIAVYQQSKQFQPGKTGFPQTADFLRRAQRGDRAGYFCIAYPEHCAGARRFEDHVVAAPSQISEPRQYDRLGIAKLWRLRPVIGILRLDDDLILLAAAL